MRDINLLQGSILKNKDALILGLVESQSNNRVIVISHDCDLYNENEEYIELIVGHIIDEPDTMYTKAHNPRRLHLNFLTKSGEYVYLELQHKNKCQILKQNFIINSYDEELFLHPEEKRVLKQWLAARYGRPAFPNAFENRLRRKKGRETVEHKIAKILKPVSPYLIALFFDLGEDRFCELEDVKPYFLSISIVYDAIEGGQEARQAAENIAKALSNLFHETYGTPDHAIEIALEECSPVADTLMTLADLRKVDQWRLEYISLSETPSSAFIAAGQQPA